MDLMELLPRAVYHGEEHVADLQGAIQSQAEAARAARDDLFRQLRPSTATWGLTLYEREYGIQPDVSKPWEQRLAVWRAKRRGQGTTTKELLELMASSFTGGGVEVREQAAQYLVEICFGEIGRPPNVEDLERSVREVLPAHLRIGFLFRWRTHGELQPHTHRALAGHTHAELRGGRL